MSQFAVTLTPNRFDERAKPLTISDGSWKRAVALVDKAGSSLSLFAGADRSTTRHFAQVLKGAASKQALSAAEIKEIESLLAFLMGVGAGGFSVSRGYKSWNQ